MIFEIEFPIWKYLLKIENIPPNPGATIRNELIPALTVIILLLQSLDRP